MWIIIRVLCGLSDCTHTCVIVCVCFVAACIVREDVLQPRGHCSCLPSSSFLPLHSAPPCSCVCEVIGDNDWSGEKYCKLQLRAHKTGWYQGPCCAVACHSVATLLYHPIKNDKCSHQLRPPVSCRCLILLKLCSCPSLSASFGHSGSNLLGASHSLFTARLFFVIVKVKG